MNKTTIELLKQIEEEQKELVKQIKTKTTSVDLSSYESRVSWNNLSNE